MFSISCLAPKYFNMNKLLIIAVCFFVSSGLVILVLWPRYQDLKNLNNLIEEKKLELQNKEEYFSHLDTILKELKKYEETSLAKINSALPSHPGLPSLFAYLQKASSENGLVLKEMSVLSTTLLKEPELLSLHGVKKTSLALTLVGSYPSFKNFIQEFEKSARLVSVESISFSAPETGELFTFNTTLSVYSY